MHPTIDPIAELVFKDGTLTLKHCSASNLQRIFGNEIWTWDNRSLLWRCEALNYAKVLDCLNRHSILFRDLVPNWQPVDGISMALHPTRPEQNTALEDWNQSKRGIVVMPTGTGKTEVALRIIANLKCSTLVVAPVRDLMYQWQRRILESLSYDAGVIGDSFYHVKPISVTTYDSASIHMPKLGNRFQLIVFDECHHLAGTIRSDAARMAAAPYRLGLTATLSLSDPKSQSLVDWIGPITYELPMESVRGTTLAEYDIYKIGIHLNSDEQARYQTLSRQISAYVRDRLKTEKDFQWKQLCQEADWKPEARCILIAHREKLAIEDRAKEKLRVIEDLLQLHYGTPIIIFAGSNAMARIVSTEFLLPCLLSHCGKNERLDYLNGLRDGSYPAIVANQILDEGVDIPAVKIAIIIGGKASGRQAQQRLGRILRRSGNDRAILYEVVCQGTNEVKRSRIRRRNDAYAGTRHLKS